MSFWLHQRASVRVLSSLPAIYCYGLAGLMSLLGVGVICVRTIVPKQQRVGQIEQQLAALEAQVAAFEQVLDQHQSLSTEHGQLVAKKQAFAADIATLQDTLNNLLTLMRDHHVSCRGIVPLASKQEGLHEKSMVLLKGKGSFVKVISLLQALEQPHYPITLRAVNLVKMRGNMVALDAMVQVISVKEV